MLKRRRKKEVKKARKTIKAKATRKVMQTVGWNKGGPKTSKTTTKKVGKAAVKATAFKKKRTLYTPTLKKKPPYKKK